jgi:Nucleotidyl transferase AbiEii toxin, Type IV TA system
MATRLLTPVQLREGFHVLLLNWLGPRLREGAWRVKGGVNLRLFFGSVRYSEDIDLDADASARDAVRRTIQKAFEDGHFRRRLVQAGIRGTVPPVPTPVKNTATALKWKFQVVGQGGVPQPTKVEVSFRPKHTADEVVVEPANPAVVERYLTAAEQPLLVPRYVRQAAVRQKLVALAGRTTVQARDVFDLYALTGGDLSTIDLAGLRATLTDGTLREAYRRAFELPYDAYESKVLEFLEDADRATWSGEAQWERLQYFVGGLAEDVRGLPGGPSDAAEGDGIDADLAEGDPPENAEVVDDVVAEGGTA